MDLTVYIDDMFITTKAGQAGLDDLDAINKKFGTTLKANPEYFLGMNITYVGLGKILISSRTYIEGLEARWTEACAGPAPITPSKAKLIKDYEQALNREVTPSEELLKRYGSKVGTILYPIPCTRPDAAATVGYLARALTFPTEAMEMHADRCLR